MCVCMRVHACVCMCAYMRVRMCVSVCARVRVYVHVHGVYVHAVSSLA